MFHGPGHIAEKKNARGQIYLNDSGVILIFAAICILTLATVAFFAFNISSLFTAQSEQEAQSFRTAVAGLDGYIKTDPAGATGADEVTARMSGAIDKAELYTHSAEQASFMQAFLPNGAEAVDFGVPFADGERGKLVPGIWYFQNPGPDECQYSKDNCPCNGSGDSAYFVGPCFRELTQSDLTTHPEWQPNAMRAVVKVSDENPFSVLLGQFLGRPSMTFESAATAAFHPRRIAVLFDLSRSAHQMTHQAVDRGPSPGNMQNGAESAYKLKDTFTCVPACTTSSGTTCQYDGGSVIQGTYDAMFRYVVVAKRKTRNLALAVDPLTHYASDYQCFNSVCFNSNGSGCDTSTQNYLIDTFTSVAKGYYGPEPLTTNMYGLHYMLQSLTSKNVPGDEFSLIGYDQNTTLKNRVVSLRTVTDPELTTLATATDVKNATYNSASPITPNQQLAITKYNLFPRVDAMSYLPGALDEAFQNFLADGPNNRNAEQDIVVFTDGMSNCTVQDGACGVTEDYIVRSLQEVFNYVDSYLVPHKVRLHVLLAGNMTQPHTLAMAKGGKCVSDNDFRESAGPSDLFVNPNLEGTASKSLLDATNSKNTFYHYPNVLYSAVKKTGGVWGPIRPACPAGAQAALDSACSAKGDGVVKSVTASGTTVVDDAGRLICDPSGLSTMDQMEGYVNQILDGNLHVQVE